MRRVRPPASGVSRNSPRSENREQQHSGDRVDASADPAFEQPTAVHRGAKTKRRLPITEALYWVNVATESPSGVDMVEVRRLVIEVLAGFRARVSSQGPHPGDRVDLWRTDRAFRDAVSCGWGD